MARVQSARFLRFSCDHELFQPTYTRSNRTKGTKIMRCFPHCCPEHMPRCYCGCALHVLVTFDDLANVNVDELIVCARFETSDMEAHSVIDADTDVRFGATLTVPTAQLTLHPDDANAAWILAEKESAIKQREVAENALLFVMNNHRFPRWYYSYESGATKSQREMQHHLVVYVTTPPPASDGRYVQRGMQRLSVLSRLASPAFMLVSYRRARGEVKAPVIPMQEDPLLRLNASVDSDGDADEQQRVRRFKRELRELEQSPAAAVAAALAATFQVARVLPLRRRRRLDSGEATDVETNGNDILPTMTPNGNATQHAVNGHNSATPSRLTLSGDDSPRLRDERTHVRFALDDVLFWRKRAASVRRLRQLHVLYVLLNAINLRDIAFCLGAKGDRLRDAWLAPLLHALPADAERTSVVEELALAFRLTAFADTKSHTTTTSSSSMALSSLPVLSHGVDVLLYLITSESAQRVWRSALHVHEGGPVERDRLRLVFVETVDALYSEADSMMRRETQTALVQLVDDVFTLCFREERLAHLQTEIKRVLSGDGRSVEQFFELFVVQVRSTWLQAHERELSGMNLLYQVALCRGESVWSTRWLLDATSFRFQRLDATSSTASCSVFGWVTLLRRWMALGVNVDGLVFSIRSLLTGTDDTASAADMRLVLDDRQRSFQCFPDGWAMPSAHTGEAMHGDYIGRVKNDGNELTCELYSMCCSVDAAELTRVSVTATIWRESDCATRGIVQATVATATLQPSPRQDAIAVLPAASRHWIYGACSWTVRAEIEGVYYDIG